MPEDTATAAGSSMILAAFFENFFLCLRILFDSVVIVKSSCRAVHLLVSLSVQLGMSVASTASCGCHSYLILDEDFCFFFLLAIMR